MSSIEWTDETWNPVTGCDRVSPGCAHCYALDLAARLKGMGQAKYQRDGDPRTSGPGFGVTLHPDTLDQPLRWRRPRMVFVNSMSDLFHDEIPDEFIARVFATMVDAPQHTFQILTKRPERMRALLREWTFGKLHWRISEARAGSFHWPLPNVWLGVSIENRRFVHRADLLRATPAAVRFISAEPLLGPLMPPIVGGRAEPWPDTGSYWPPYLDLFDIDWLIVGGESGPKARPVNPAWVRNLRDSCLLVDAPERTYDPADPMPLPELDRTAFFFKQWGGRHPKAGGRELDGRTWDEMPAEKAA